MKKLLLSVFIILSGLQTNAQSLSGDFETWRNISTGGAGLEAPYNWYGIDSLAFTFGTLAGINPQKLLFKDADAHSGSFAAKLMSRDVNGQVNVISAVLVNAMPTFDIFQFDPNDPMAAVGYVGGTPISQRILTVTAWLKYLPNGFDRSSVTVQAVLSGQGAGGEDSVVGEGIIILEDSIDVYTAKTVNITYQNGTVVPDKILVAFQTSIITSASQPGDSTTMYVDGVTMSAVSVEEIPEKLNGFVVYPNPTNGKINIAISEKGTYTWKAYDMTGKEVLSKSFSHTTTADATHLPNGTYLFSIYDESMKLTGKGKFNILK